MGDEIVKKMGSLLLMLIVPGPGLCNAADLFVSTLGNDVRADGSSRRPYRTIAKALERARAGDRVVIRAGEYRQSKPLRFPRSGEPGRPITVTAHKDEYVALLGSVRLTGWQKHAGRIWKVKTPPGSRRGIVRGVYEDGERLTHPRPDWGKRENPPIAELRTPGTWTQQDGWIYVWSREGDSPDKHRIEASQHGVVNMNKAWLRLEKLHLFFGESTVLVIHGDHSEAVDCEISHCSNSVDNSYGAYFSGCSHSAMRNCTIHDSFYWGDHGSNSHVLSTINCGDDGPNFVDRCEIFNGGLGVGTKGAARELVVTGNRIYDVVSGVVISGERSSGPGAGKKDRGHYLVYRNRITDCAKGVYFSSGDTHENRVWNNLFERCGNGIYMRNYKGEPDRTHLANNVFLDCNLAVQIVGGRKGAETLAKFTDAGLRSHNNLYHGNKVDWRNPITWSRNLDLPVSKVQSYKGLGLEKGALTDSPKLDAFGRSLRGCPAVGKGAGLPLPKYVPVPDAWHVGLGPYGKKEQKPEAGLTLSIAGCPQAVAPGDTLRLRATLRNEFRKKSVPISGDAIVTYHFRYRGGHFDKQEIYRTRVTLPEKLLKPGQSIDLTGLRGWKNPTNRKLGDPFHLRTDNRHWKSGCRLRATLRFVDAEVDTAKALQRLETLLRSREILPIRLK